MSTRPELVDLTARPWGPLVGGEILATGASRDITEPWSGDLVARVAVGDESTADRAVDVAAAAAPEAAGMPAHRRAAILRRAADIAEGRVDELAQIITRETGKVIKDTRGEVRRVPWVLRAAATAAEALRGELHRADAMPGGEGITAFTIREPVGVVAAITPFNAPMNLATHKMAPSVAAGNTMVVKPPSVAPLPALAMAQLLEEAGLPAGIVNVVPGGPAVGQAMIRRKEVRVITLTGGRAAGEAVAAAAGLRRVLLELGGNSANLVHRDADLQLAVRECLSGGFSNNGQSCNSVQRIYLHTEIFDQFARALVDGVARLRVGDPMDPETDVGPLIDEDAARRVADAVAGAAGDGAEVMIGGGRDGAVFQPTVVAHAPDTCPLSVEEAFAPIVLLYGYDDLDDAIRRANDSDYGLQSAVFTDSIEVARRAVRGLAAGAVLVNRASKNRLDHLPYGGIKTSGLGREGPAEAVLELTEPKLVWLG